MRARTDRIHPYGRPTAMSGRLRNDLRASLLTRRFLVPTGTIILLVAIVVWLVRGH
jgi:hypothetical protein